MSRRSRNLAAPSPAPTSTISTVTDPVTGRSFSRDTSVAGSTYAEVKNTTQPVQNTGAVAVPPAALSGNNRLSVPQPQQFDSAAALVNSVRSSLPQTATVSQARTDMDKGYERYDRALAQLGERGQRRQKIEDKLGVTRDTQRLQDLNLAISQRAAEFDTLEQSLEGQGRGISLGVITSQQGAVRRQKAAEVGAMASMAQALQGNIQLSRQLADSAIENEFAGLEQEIQRSQLFIQRNRDRMSDAQKEQADELNLYLDDYKTQVADKKQDRRDILNLANEVAAQGFPQIAQQIQKSQDIDAAFALAAPYVGRMERANQQSIMANRGASGGSSSSSTTSKNEVAEFLRTGFGDQFAPQGQDGFVDPYAYIYAFQNWGGTTKSFIDAFPPVRHINPASYGVLPPAIATALPASTRNSSGSGRSL